MNKLLLIVLLLVSPFVNAQVVNYCDSETGYTAPAYATLHNGEFMGNARVFTFGDHIYFEFDMDPTLYPRNFPIGWEIRAVYIQASTGPVPQSGGELLPGFFGYQRLFQIGSQVANMQQPIPLSEIGASCGTPINIAIYVVIQQVQFVSVGNYVTLDARNGFVQGPSSVQVGTGWTWQHGVCCDEVTGCTKTSSYYKTHSTFSKPAQRDPWPISESTLTCGVTWHSILNTKSSDNWYKLASQWIGSMLNIGDGASTPADIDQALLDGQSLLESTCRTMPKAQKATAASLSALLETYNNGALQPPACPATP